jgi:hypothetical protein
LPPFQLGLSVDCNLPYNASRFMSLAEMSWTPYLLPWLPEIWNRKENMHVILASLEQHPDRIWLVHSTYFLVPVYEPRNRCKQEHLGEATADHHAKPKALLEVQYIVHGNKSLIIRKRIQN